MSRNQARRETTSQSRNRSVKDLAGESELWLIRCIGCGKPLAHLRAKYEALLRSNVSKAQALDKLHITRMCCRSAALAPPKIPLGLLFDNSGMTGHSQKSSDSPLSHMSIDSINSELGGSPAKYERVSSNGTPFVEISKGFAPEEVRESFVPYKVDGATKPVRIHIAK